MKSSNHQFQGKITLAITGASGAGYAIRLIECLVAANYQLYVLISSAGRIVLDTELGLKVPASPDNATVFLTSGCPSRPLDRHSAGSDDCWVVFPEKVPRSIC